MPLGVDDVKQPHDVGVAHLLEQRDLADGRRRDALVLGLEPDLLQGDDAAAGGEVAGAVQDTIGTWGAEGSVYCVLSLGQPRVLGELYGWDTEHTLADLLELLVVLHGA